MDSLLLIPFLLALYFAGWYIWENNKDNYGSEDEDATPEP